MGEGPDALTPKERVASECARRGDLAVVATCRDLVRGRSVDPDLLIALAGPGATKYFDGRPHDDVYWWRVWGARGLLWNWDASATDDVRVALTDDAWRVREMALKVVARHQLGDLVDDAAARREDPVPRVRAAADRAIAVLTASGA